MKYVLVFLIALGAAAPLASCAQNMPTEITKSDLAKQLAIQKAMLKVIGGLANNFADFKGDLLKTADDGSTYYTVKNLDMETPTQYIMVNPRGIPVYIAVFSADNLDIKLPLLSSAAFKGLDKQNGLAVNQTDSEQGKQVVKYTLSFENLHPATFLLDVVKIQGTLVVANQ